MRTSLSKITMTAAAGVLGFALLFGGAATPSISQDAASASSEAPSAEPAAPTEEQILAGLAVWKDRGGCFNCHGNFGQGGEGGHFPAGPSLRKTQLDLETLHLVIACGLPTTKMPYNLKGAYETDDFCYGETGGVPTDLSPGATLSNEEITDLVAYMEARMVGQRRITKAQCVEYFGDANYPECAAYR
ncbi:MAG: hypothetical protein EOP22_06090 [Hyphomicrobiales bacterium]|nr:MAG: hypothetical protein EOP22_06090 [Hyphomicrobiales bacterium]